MTSAEKFVPNYTFEDYQNWKGDWELWQGVAVSMLPSPFGLHSSSLVSVGTAFANSIAKSECDASVLGNLDWIISRDTVLRPDVMIVCGAPPEKHQESPPAVVVEILSDSTRERDTTFKRKIYQAQSVPYYLIVDPAIKSLIALKLESATYVEVDAGSDLDMHICETCHLKIPASAIFE